MLRIHVMQQWFSLSDPGMEEAFFDVQVCREFTRLEDYARLPDERTLLHFPHRLEQHLLAERIEHPFRVLKRQFGFAKVRYKGLKKNTAQLVTLFALSNLWMARHKLMALPG